jgi:hypothetical protein
MIAGRDDVLVSLECVITLNHPERKFANSSSKQLGPLLLGFFGEVPFVAMLHPDIKNPAHCLRAVIKLDKPMTFKTAGVFRGWSLPLCPLG